MALFQNCFLLFLIVFDGSFNLQSPEVTIIISAPKNIVIGETFEVSATISKGNLNSFAKVQLNFPAGFIPKPIETENSKFLFQKNTVKFIWDRLPLKSELMLKMTVNTAKASEGIKGISGIFAYLDGTVKNEKRIQNTIVRIELPSAASNFDLETSESDQNVSEIIVQKPIEPEPTEVLVSNKETIISKTEPEVSTNQKNNNEIVPIQTGKLEFRIQIAASSNSIDKKTLAYKFNIDRPIMEETHDGMLKYTVGPYSTYTKAREKQAYYQVKKGVKGAFITTYKNGKRIPFPKP